MCLKPTRTNFINCPALKQALLIKEFCFSKNFLKSHLKSIIKRIANNRVESSFPRPSNCNVNNTNTNYHPLENQAFIRNIESIFRHYKIYCYFYFVSRFKHKQSEYSHVYLSSNSIRVWTWTAVSRPLFLHAYSTSSTIGTRTWTAVSRPFYSHRYLTPCTTGTWTWTAVSRPLYSHMLLIICITETWSWSTKSHPFYIILPTAANTVLCVKPVLNMLRECNPIVSERSPNGR